MLNKFRTTLKTDSKPFEAPPTDENLIIYSENMNVVFLKPPQTHLSAFVRRRSLCVCVWGGLLEHLLALQKPSKPAVSHIPERWVCVGSVLFLFPAPCLDQSTAQDQQWENLKDLNRLSGSNRSVLEVFPPFCSFL